MKVKILCEFEVESLEDDDELTENQAKDAASIVAYNFLSLVTVSGANTDVESVVVPVDGFGECRVSIGQEHE